MYLHLYKNYALVTCTSNKLRCLRKYIYFRPIKEFSEMNEILKAQKWWYFSFPLMSISTLCDLNGLWNYAPHTHKKKAYKKNYWLTVYYPMPLINLANRNSQNTCDVLETRPPSPFTVREPSKTVRRPCRSASEPQK